MATKAGSETPRASISSDDTRTAHRPSLEAEQGERLLSGEALTEHADDEEQNYKVEWHLRTVWVVASSAIAVCLVFLILVLFTRHFIVDDNEQAAGNEAELTIGFRRSSSDYILDPKWNFNAARKERRYHWIILDRIANPDGIYRPMITINGQFPGPMIECNEGDTLVIDIDNRSANATSIHFHGIFQNGTNWMDGTNGVTQCPIAPKGKFQYKFKTDGQSGTYYYHGHQAVQIADGLFGPLVVHSRDEKKLQTLRYKTDRVVMLQDYYHDLSSGLLRSSLEPGSETEPIPDGALINGLNTRDCGKYSARLCDNTTSRLPSFNLSPNNNHRLRFINTGAFAWFEVSLDEHELAITEVDGTIVKPTYVAQIHISPAQRYSAIISTNHAEENSFWLRARMIRHCFSDFELPRDGADQVNAIVRYSKNSPTQSLALISQPTSKPWTTGYAVECRDMDHTQFVSVPAIAAPATADHSYFIRSNMEIGDWRLQRGFFNRSTFRPDLKSPSLHRTIEGLRSENDSFKNTGNGVNEAAFNVKNELVIQHEGVKVIDLILQNFDEGNHPLHLHGHKFWVLAQAHGYFPGYEKLNLNLSNPLKRDVATLEGYGWMLLRFVTDNPGIWAFHCHMAWHSEAGLVMQFLNQPEIMATWEIPDANKDLCAAEGLEKGAKPKDEIWFGFGIG